MVGLRYFNVYGPREQHKGRMMSVLHQLLRQLQETGACRLFEGTEGYGNGEQVRDFVFVDDIVDINLHFAEGPVRKGIFNAGTGQARSFNAIARTLIQQLGQGRIEYIPFPEVLQGQVPELHPGGRGQPPGSRLHRPLHAPGGRHPEDPRGARKLLFPRPQIEGLGADEGIEAARGLAPPGPALVHLQEAVASST